MLNDKYRPKMLKDVIGQSFVTSTLQKKLDTNTMPHAMLFVGHAGCSKTTLARIMANNLNSYITEFDAASNNSVEAVRAVIESCKTKPLGYDNRFLIIDEPQRFSKVSWDSLLKFIEEPPAFVYIAMCTTEEQKVPNTIKSRCETFRILPISPHDIYLRLEYICKAEHFESELSALRLIAVNSDNNMRQAISNLEMLSASQPITDSLVTKELLKTTYTDMMNIIYNYIDHNYSNLIITIYGTVDAGSLSQKLFTFLLDLSVYFKTEKFSLTNIPEPLYNSIK